MRAAGVGDDPLRVLREVLRRLLGCRQRQRSDGDSIGPEVTFGCEMKHFCDLTDRSSASLLPSRLRQSRPLLGAKSPSGGSCGEIVDVMELSLPKTSSGTNCL